MARTRTWWSLRVSSVCPAATMYAVCVCVRARARVCAQAGAVIPASPYRYLLDPSHGTRRSESRYPARIRVTVIRVARGGRVLWRRRRRRRGRGACLHVRGRMAGDGPGPAHHRPRSALSSLFSHVGAHIGLGTCLVGDVRRGTCQDRRGRDIGYVRFVGGVTGGRVRAAGDVTHRRRWCPPCTRRARRTGCPKRRENTTVREKRRFRHRRTPQPPRRGSAAMA